MGIIQVLRQEDLPYLTVEENLMMGAYLQKTRIRSARAWNGALNYFPALKGKFKQKGRELSGGQQQNAGRGGQLGGCGQDGQSGMMMMESV